MSELTEFERAFDGPLFVFEAALSEDGFLLKYAEERDQSENIALDKIIQVVPHTMQRQIVFAEIQELLQWVVDDGLRELRNPELYQKDSPRDG